MTFPLFVFSIDREIFVGEASSLIVPSQLGEIQILANHAPLISLLKEGDILIERKKEAGDFEKERIPIKGGVVEVSKGEVVALVDF